MAGVHNTGTKKSSPISPTATRRGVVTVEGQLLVQQDQVIVLHVRHEQGVNAQCIGITSQVSKLAHRTEIARTHRRDHRQPHTRRTAAVAHLALPGCGITTRRWLEFGRIEVRMGVSPHNWEASSGFRAAHCAHCLPHSTIFE
jgi:hypothetical protein